MLGWTGKREAVRGGKAADIDGLYKGLGFELSFER